MIGLNGEGAVSEMTVSVRGRINRLERLDGR